MTQAHKGAAIRRVAIVFSGGPAPAANAVIAAAASAFKRAGSEVIGLLQGYSHLLEREGREPPEAPRSSGKRGSALPERPSLPVPHRVITDADLRGLRNARGVLIGTSRANPGRGIGHLRDLDDPQMTRGLRTVHRELRELNVDALISIGGDGTLRTANLLYEYQRRLDEDVRRVRVVHVPKTIDNDYGGIDFTFGFFTAVDVMAKELLNLRADAIATQSYYIVSTMGRRAGWLAYGVAIAGEAHLVVGVEDVQHALRTTDGKLDLEKLGDHIADLIVTREARGKRYGVVVLAEGLSELLPEGEIAGIPRDDHGHISFAKLDFGKLMAELAATRHKARTGKNLKVTGLQLGYESRCAAPHAFDVLLGSQLGLGAYRALVEEELDGVMISVSGQLDLRYVPFAKLVDPETLTTKVRFIDRGSDFHRLAQQLGTRIEERK
jgi:ATP-dependent phosphofructokinase / diphosphate-dependent phosphofructokinase